MSLEVIREEVVVTVPEVNQSSLIKTPMKILGFDSTIKVVKSGDYIHFSDNYGKKCSFYFDAYSEAYCEWRKDMSEPLVLIGNGTYGEFWAVTFVQYHNNQVTMCIGIKIEKIVLSEIVKSLDLISGYQS